MIQAGVTLLKARSTFTSRQFLNPEARKVPVQMRPSGNDSVKDESPKTITISTVLNGAMAQRLPLEGQRVKSTRTWNEERGHGGAVRGPDGP